MSFKDMLNNVAGKDDSLTFSERSNVVLASYSPVILDVLLAKVADEAEVQGYGVNITPDQIIKFLTDFFNQVWPLLLDAIKSIIALFS